MHTKDWLWTNSSSWSEEVHKGISYYLLLRISMSPFSSRVAHSELFSSRFQIGQLISLLCAKSFTNIFVHTILLSRYCHGHFISIDKKRRGFPCWDNRAKTPTQVCWGVQLSFCWSTPQWRSSQQRVMSQRSTGDLVTGDSFEESSSGCKWIRMGQSPAKGT